MSDKLEIEIIATDNASKVFGGLGSTFGELSKLGGIVTGALAGVGTGLGALAASSIGTNAQLETSTLQFETLLGSADAAKAHIQDLYKFGAATPFETGPIIDASKSLLTFGGASLDTMENLTKFGNAASVTGVGIDEVAYTMGRAYSAIQAGKPFGEAAQRLQEMGVLTAEGRTQLEELQASGADSATVWASLTGSFDRFNGSMEKQASTWEGLTSTIKDVLQQALGTAMLPLFEALKTSLGEVLRIVSGPEFTAALTAISQAFAGMLSGVVAGLPGFITGFQNVFKFFVDNKPILVGVLAALGVAITAFGISVATAAWAAISPMLPVIAIMAAVGAAVAGLYALWTSDFGGIRTTMEQVWQALQPVFNQVRQWLAVFIPQAGAVLKNFWDNSLAPAFRFLGQVIDSVLRVAGALIVGWVQSAVANFQRFVGFIDLVRNAFNGIVGAIRNVIGWVDSMIQKLLSISLPSWLTPGSPTPFQIGLEGIGEAMRDLTVGPLPKMAVGLRFGEEGVPLGGLAAAGATAGGPTFVVNYNPVFSTADREELRSRLQPVFDQAIREYNRGTRK